MATVAAVKDIADMAKGAVVTVKGMGMEEGMSTAGMDMADMATADMDMAYLATEDMVKVTDMDIALIPKDSDITSNAYSCL